MQRKENRLKRKKEKVTSEKCMQFITLKLVNRKESPMLPETEENLFHPQI